MIAKSSKPRAATLNDLMRVEGKAELIRGDIIHYEPLGVRPGRIIMTVISSLFAYGKHTKIGEVGMSKLAYGVKMLSSGRESFSPEASFYIGPSPEDPMSYIPGPPTFAVELTVRNVLDHRTEKQLAAKRADYFEAGTRVVWEIDLLARKIFSYNTPNMSAIFTTGQIADAEPAVPGWHISVDEIFEEDD